jgi:Putative Actinobacterial Holin-X, holin superfamily III
MPIPGNGVGAAVHEVTERASALARLEAELAAAEIRQKVSSLGGGIVVLGAGVLIGLYALGFLFATIAAALATFMPTWLALFLVGAALLLVAAAVIAIGSSLLHRGVPPVPEQAIAEARLTGEVLRRSSDDG